MSYRKVPCFYDPCSALCGPASCSLCQVLLLASDLTAAGECDWEGCSSSATVSMGRRLSASQDGDRMMPSMGTVQAAVQAANSRGRAALLVGQGVLAPWIPAQVVLAALSLFAGTPRGKMDFTMGERFMSHH